MDFGTKSTTTRFASTFCITHVFEIGLRKTYNGFLMDCTMFNPSSLFILPPIPHMVLGIDEGCLFLLS
jgi:hypothetical protein